MLAHIEGATKPIINKVSTKIRLEDGDKETLAMFLAFLMNRVPDFEKSINHVEKHLIKWVMDITWGDEKHAAATLAKFEQDTGNTATITPAQMVEWNRTGAFKINIHRNRSLHLMMALSLSTGNWFKQMEWMFLHAPNKTSFVTSDNPLCLLSPEWHNPKAGYGVGLLTKGAVKVVALNQRTCLLMFDRGDTMSHADGKIEDVRKINHELTVNTDRFLVGRDHALLANLAKRTRLAEWERKGRISIG
jgi:hypothetical protein